MHEITPGLCLSMAATPPTASDRHHCGIIVIGALEVDGVELELDLRGRRLDLEERDSAGARDGLDLRL